MKNIYRITIFLFLTFVISSCSDESSLGEVGNLEPDYILPQGKSPADDRIVTFYENYGSFMLYEYSWLDFHYDISALHYVYSSPDPQYIGNYLDILEETWFSFYPKEFNKSYIPYKIFFTDTLFYRRNEEDTHMKPVSIVIGDNAVAFGGCSQAITQLSVSDKSVFKNTLQKELWKNWINTQRIEIPHSFYEVSSYAYVAERGDEGYRGFIKGENGRHWCNYGNREGKLDPKKDIESYIVALLTWTSEMWETEFQNSKVQMKYSILKNFFIEKYNVDLTKIGNATFED